MPLLLHCQLMVGSPFCTMASPFPHVSAELCARLITVLHGLSFYMCMLILFDQLQVTLTSSLLNSKSLEGM